MVSQGEKNRTFKCLKVLLSPDFSGITPSLHERRVLAMIATASAFPCFEFSFLVEHSPHRKAIKPVGKAEQTELFPGLHGY